MRPFLRPGGRRHASRPAIVGHRGAPRLAPENTPASFVAAAAAGADWVELDVRRAADGTLVVAHDPDTADGVPIVALRADVLRAAGVVPFEEVLDRLPEWLGVDVEVKNSPAEPDYDEADRAAAALAVLLEAEARPLLLSSFNPSTVRVLRAALPGVPAGLVHGPTTPVRFAAALAVDLDAAVVCAHRAAPGLDRAGVAGLHESGLELMVWTVDDADEARALAAAGVDALCTNDPGGLAGVLGPADDQLRRPR